MILSIGMIVKNEEKYLEQCLNGIKPILDNVDSELIIADTGSTDRTVEIAKKFTDNVYHFEWINDFAAARNSTIERSKGKWYMYLDADEVFQSCDDIISFFNSGEYKKYTSALINLRSFTNETMDKYTDNYAYRLTVKTQNTYFEGAVHEGIIVIYKPIRKLSDIVYHYGYIFRDKDNKLTDLARQKNERNIRMINDLINEKEQKKEEVPPILYKELADSYANTDDKYDKSLEYYKLALEKADHSQYYVTLLYDALASYYFSQNNYEELNRLANEYMAEPIRKDPLILDLSMYEHLINSYASLGYPEKAVNYIVPFFEMYKKYANNRITTVDMLYVVMRMSPDHYNDLCKFCLQTCVRARKFNTAEYVLNISDMEAFCSDEEWMKWYIDYCVPLTENLGYKKMKECYSKFTDKHKEKASALFRKKITDSDNPGELLNFLQSEYKEDSLENDFAKLYTSIISGDDNVSEMVDSYLTKYTVSASADIFYMLLKNGLDISLFLKHLNNENIKSFTNSFLVGFENSYNALENYETDIISPEVMLWTVFIYESLLFDGERTGRNIFIISRKFGEVCVKYMQSTNSPAPIEDISAGLILHSISEAHDNRDYKLCISELRRLLGEHPKFRKIIITYKDALQKEVSMQH